MKIIKGGLLALSALIAIGAADISAQDEAEREVRRGARGGVGVEVIMSMRERLELTEDQIASLDAIRRDFVAQRSTDRAEMAEMRSQLQAGQIRQSEMMAFMENRRDAAAGTQDQHRARIDGILSEAQRESLADMRSRGRAFAGRRAGARRGAAMRGGRSFRGGAAGGGWNRQGMGGRGQGGIGGPPRRGRRGPPDLNRRGGDEAAPGGELQPTGGSS